MNKQLLFVFATFLCGMLSYGQTFESNGINYTVTDAVAKTVEVAVNADYTGDAVIPATVIDNRVTYQVTGIGVGAFRDCRGLTSVSIANSVISIGSTAFSNCTGITSLDIPNSITSIEAAVFSGCRSLTSISVPDSVTSIGNSAFNQCVSLTSLDIPDSVTSIGPAAFRSCTLLTSITIPDSVTDIADLVFSNCVSLTSINLPDSVTGIGGSVFRGCAGLTSIVIPDSVPSIGIRTFFGCTNLTSIRIPDSVINIGNYAFAGCIRLTSVTVAHASPLVIDSNVFDNVNTAGAILNVPAGSASAYRTADVWKDFGTVLHTEELQKNAEAFNMFPIPNNGILNIKSRAYDAFQIINQYGQEVKRFEVTPGVTTKLNTGFLSDGVYYVKAVQAQGIGAKKLIVKR